MMAQGTEDFTYNGNKEFDSAALSIRKSIDEYGSPELDWFMENLLDAFTVTLDEIGF